MKNVIISCDTTIALTRTEIEKLGIEVIPLNVIADGVEYHDTVDIDSKRLCELMRGKAKISTSTPTIVEIENYFDDIFSRKNPDVIIHFTISSKLSSMFSLFTTVCKEKYGDRVIVCDSYSVCNFMANQVRYAKSLADQGVSV
ncbi:MAG: DegV family protein, partial [Bacilli bacterium]